MSPCTSREGGYCDSIDRVRGFRTLQEKAGAGGRRAAVSQDTTKAVVWRPTSTLSSPAPKQSGNTRATCRGVVDKFGGSGFLATATNQFGCGFVLDTKFGPRYDVTQPLWNLTGRLRLEVCRSNDFTSTTTHFVLSQGDLRQCCHRKLASSCSQTLDSGTPVVFVVVCQKIQTVAAHPLTARALSDYSFWITMQKTNIVSGLEVWTTERFAPCCSNMCLNSWRLQCFRTETFSSEGFRITLRVLLFT